MTNSKSDRHYHRVTLQAPLLLTNQQQQVLHGICINFSEDGLDLQPDDAMTLFNAFRIHAGDVVTVQIENVEQAPELAAAVIKASPKSIGLRFLTEKTKTT